MRKQFGNNIDQIFKRKLKNAEVEPPKDAWAAIQGKLAQEPIPITSRFPSFKTIVGISSSVAAVLAILIFTFNSSKENGFLSNYSIFSNLDIETISIKINSNNDFSDKKVNRLNTKPTNNSFILQEKNVNNSDHTELASFGLPKSNPEKSSNKILAAKSEKNTSTKQKRNQLIESSNPIVNSVIPNTNSNVETNKQTTIQAIFLPNLDKIFTSDSENKLLDIKKSEYYEEDYYSEKKKEERRLAYEIFSELSILASLPISNNYYYETPLKKRTLKKFKQKESKLYLGLVYQFNRSWQKLNIDQNYLSNIEANINYEAIYGNAYGISLNWQTKSNWEFETQFILNSTQGGKFKMDYIEFDQQKISFQDIKYTYTQIPLLLKKRIHLSFKDNFISKIKMGVIGGFQYSTLKETDNIVLGNGVQHKDVIRKTELGFIGGLEIDYTLSKSLSFRIGGRITAANKPTSILQFHNNTSSDAYNMQAGITTGLVFRLK